MKKSISDNIMSTPKRGKIVPSNSKLGSTINLYMSNKKESDGSI